MIWSSCKQDYKWNPNLCNCNCNKACRIDDYLDMKICFLEKHLIGKLVLECEDEILNTTETLLDDKKQRVQKVIVLFILFYW